MSTILITVDALRADHLAQYGYERDTMPVLDRLTEDGTIFKNAFANGPYTRISVPSFHTSTYLGYQNIESLPTIASTLAAQNVQTVCIGTRTGFSSVEGDLHFDQYVDLGRDKYHAESEQAQPLTEKAVEKSGDILRSIPPVYRVANAVYEGVGKFGMTHFSYKGYQSAEQVTDSAVDWLSKQQDTDFFLWLHYMEGHRPYGVHDDNPTYTDPASDEQIRHLMRTAGTEPDAVTISEHTKMIDLYDSDLRYCSQQLERLLDELQDLNLWQELNIIFTSDHGEEFYDHDMYYHKNLPYDELLHVPLIVRSEDPAETVTEQRELLDIAPTVLNFHGVDQPESFCGKDLFQSGRRDIIAVGSQSQEGQTVAGRESGYKYIWTEDGEFLFNLSMDSMEEQNLIDERPEFRERFLEMIPPEILNAQEEQLREPDNVVDQKQLEALGYLES